MSESQSVESLLPFRYPAWLKVTAAVVLLAFVYALILLPPYYRAGCGFRLASQAATEGNTRLAVSELLAVLKLAPGSERARVELAILCFQQKDDGIRRLGLSYLGGIKIRHEDCDRIAAVMPSEFQAYFHDVKN
jgi:hypothetical protein